MALQKLDYYIAYLSNRTRYVSL